MGTIYAFIIRLLHFLGRCAIPISPKVKKWYQYRAAQSIATETTPSIWVHCASLGEYLQAKPIIQKIKKNKPKQNIVLTFFSTSGYENFQDHDLIDQCYLLPIDLPQEMEACIQKINPSLVIFVKNEVWFTLLSLLTQLQIPFIYIATTLDRKSRVLRLTKLPFFSSMLSAHAIFVQQLGQKNGLDTYGFSNIIVAGDSRIDHTLDVKNRPFSDRRIEQFIGEAKHVFICGSTHLADEKLVIDCLENSYFDKIIIAPHEVNEGRIQEIIRRIKGRYILHSDHDSDPRSSRWMIIDQIGILSSAYRYATVVYVGGGFGAGIHNTLEPAVYGKPILFGPRFTKFKEAVDFIELSCAYVVEDKVTLQKVLVLLKEENKRQIIKQKLTQYFDNQPNASDIIYEEVRPNLLPS